MTLRFWLALCLTGGLFSVAVLPNPAPACMPAPLIDRGGHIIPVVNADQTVIMIWDPAAQTQHFIRQASFKTDADNVGFIVPSPSRPELDESGNEAFPYLQGLTAPDVYRKFRASDIPNPLTMFCCGMSSSALDCAAPPPVRVLEEKRVAGFDAVVLEADSSSALVDWLKSHNYGYLPEMEVWARPYIGGGWKFTAMKVAEREGGKHADRLSAGALRISFKTDRPLFPYREPDNWKTAADLGVNNRLLRIFFIADARYQGDLTGQAWTGKVAWAGKLSAENRTKLLDMLKLPHTTGPADWFLTEFEDHWPYRLAPSDLYFSRCRDQRNVKRPAEYVSSGWPKDVTVYAIAAVVFVPSLWSRLRRKWRAISSRF